MANFAGRFKAAGCATLVMVGILAVMVGLLVSFERADPFADQRSPLLQYDLVVDSFPQSQSWADAMAQAGVVCHYSSGVVTSFWDTNLTVWVLGRTLDFASSGSRSYVIDTSALLYNGVVPNSTLLDVAYYLSGGVAESAVEPSLDQGLYSIEPRSIVAISSVQAVMYYEVKLRDTGSHYRYSAGLWTYNPSSGLAFQQLTTNGNNKSCPIASVLNQEKDVVYHFFNDWVDSAFVVKVAQINISDIATSPFEYQFLRRGSEFSESISLALSKPVITTAESMIAVNYNKFLERYLVITISSNGRNIIARTATVPWGRYSDKVIFPYPDLGSLRIRSVQILPSQEAENTILVSCDVAGHSYGPPYLLRLSLL
ncbi:hypothetical protein Pelo_9191 [Pelomyxa schiedti]|nr:hypothetical protein Pelo_9191 [Pelomyxa schiedti]